MVSFCGARDFSKKKTTLVPQVRSRCPISEDWPQEDGCHCLELSNKPMQHPEIPGVWFLVSNLVMIKGTSLFFEITIYNIHLSIVFPDLKWYKYIYIYIYVYPFCMEIFTARVAYQRVATCSVKNRTVVVEIFCSCWTHGRVFGPIWRVSLFQDRVSMDAFNRKLHSKILSLNRFWFKSTSISSSCSHDFWSFHWPSGKHTQKNYWKWPFIIDLPIENGGMFHRFFHVCQRVNHHFWHLWSYISRWNFPL